VKPENVSSDLRSRVHDVLRDKVLSPHPLADELAERAAGLVMAEVQPTLEQLRAQIADEVREERAANIAGIKAYFAAVDDPLYEDVEILCGRIKRGEYGSR
jgi:DNA-binding LacI/PurR family transcriptional regulator